jgi:hypothetical protein
MSRMPTIESTCADAIDERGPTPLADLAAEMVRLGRTRARNPEMSVASALRTRSGWYELADGRWTTVRRAFRDVRFAHRLGADEIARGWIDLHPDFSPLLSLPEFARRWGVEPNLGIPATLGDLAPGAVIVGGVDEGRLVLARAPEDALPEATPGQRAAFAEAARDALEAHGPSIYYPGVALEEMFVLLVTNDPATFSGTTLVIADLIAAAGLETRDGQVASAGTDWAAHDRLLDDLRYGTEDELGDDDLDDGAGYWPVDDMPDSAFPRATDRTKVPAPRPLTEPLVSVAVPRFRRGGRRPAKRCLQLRIRLFEVRPPIWRRVLVPTTITLDRLHAVVQEAMGWSDMHLHEFGLGRDRWGDVDIEDNDGRLLDEFDVRLRPLVAPGHRLHYRYDLGDDWRHEIVIEGEVDGIAGELYPLCLDGAGACPPEDCGGISGFRELLEALAHPRTRRHRDLLRWLGGPFDPSAFSVEEVNARLDLLG